MTAVPNPPSSSRVLLCGTGFGRIYLQALTGTGEPDPDPLTLAAVLARGSERSRAAAAGYGVPLHTDTSTVGDVDLAAVVVPAAVGGGPGPRIAQEMLARGVPTLLEHPVHADELADCLRAAARHRTAFALNTFYVHLEPVRRFLAAAAELRRRTPVTGVELGGSVHVAFDLVDIAAQAVGALQPWALGDPPELPDRLAGLVGPDGFAHRALDGVLGGVPAALRIHNHTDVADPDHPSHLQHRVAIGTEAGTLVLVATHGPVLWCPALRVPRDETGSLAPGAGGAGGAELLDVPGVVPIGPAHAPGIRETFDVVWPDGARRALRALRAASRRGDDPLVAGRRHLVLATLWAELIGRLGYPAPVRHPDDTAPVSARDLCDAVRADGVPV